MIRGLLLSPTNVWLWLFLFCFIGVANAESQRLRLVARENPSHSMTIAWQQVQGGTATVHYGTTDHGESFADYEFVAPVSRSIFAKNMVNQFARLSNLAANTTYYFVIKDEQSVSERYYFKTTPEFIETPTSYVFTGSMSQDVAARQRGFSMISKLRPDLVLLGGDFTENSLFNQWQSWLDDWQLTTSEDGRMYPLVPIKGDQERFADDLINLFDVISPQSYFGLNIGANIARLYVLNSDLANQEGQRQWLNNDLSLNAAKFHWKFATYHNPIRSMAASGNTDEDAYDNWTDIFNQYQLDLALEGGGGIHKITQPIRAFAGNGSASGFIVDSLRGTVYIGEGSLTGNEEVADDIAPWVLQSAALNQLKWGLITKDSLALRTVLLENESDVGALSSAAPKFTLPPNIQLLPVNQKEQLNIPSIKARETFVRITHPEENELIRAPTFKLNWEMGINNDPSVINRVRVFIDKTLYSNYNFPVTEEDITGLSSGIHEIQIIVNAANGSQAVSLGRTVFIDEKEQQPRIAAGSYDAIESKITSVVTLNDDRIFLGETELIGLPEPTLAGLLFSGFTIPKDAILHEAYIQFTAGGSDETEAANFNIFRMAGSNLREFASQPGDLSARLRSSDFVAWEVAPWPLSFFSAEAQRTPNLVELLEEQLLQSANGISLAGFLIEGTGKRTAFSFEGDLRRVPQLTIRYTDPNTGTEIVERSNTQIRVFPNPVADKLYVSGAGSQWEYFSICELDGREVTRGAAEELENGWSVIGLPAGIYVLKLQGRTEMVSTRFMRR